jgi:hypothetical protein
MPNNGLHATRLKPDVRLHIKEHLPVSKLPFALMLMAFPSVAWADTANCIVEIEDMNAGSKYKIEHSFRFKPGFDAQRKHFALPGSGFSCTLTFFDLNSGTMLSCQLDELGHNFVQSDRSAIDEGPAKNNLSFRFKSALYVLESLCK